MPPRKAAPPSSSAKPPSKAPASKPLSTKPPSAKAPSTKPISTRPPSSRRGAASTPAVATPAPEPTIPEDEDVVMSTPKKGDVSHTNGGDKHTNGGDKPNGNGLKRGRVGELTEEAKKTRRRSSIGSVLKNDIPQPPLPAEPHTALFIFGTGDMGQLGLGPDMLDEITRPRLHAWFENEIAAGKLSKDGKPGSGGLEAAACGGMHTLAIDEGGRIRSWGINDNAALGRQTVGVPDPDYVPPTPPNEDLEMKDDVEMDGDISTAPVKEKKEPIIPSIPNEDLETVPFVIESLLEEGFRAVQVAAGDSVSVAVSDQGEVRAWGSFRSSDGVLGFDGVRGNSPFQFSPIALKSFQKAKVKVVQVSCGSDFVLALTTTGHVYGWGDGEQQQLGRRILGRRRLNGLEPERLSLRNIVVIATGMYHSFAVDSNGIVWAWGLNTFHQTGVSSSRGGDEDTVTVPTQVDELHPAKHNGGKVIQIQGGEHHSVFLFDNGEVWACGRTDAHQVGIAEDHPAMINILEIREEIRQAKKERLQAAEQRMKELGLDPALTPYQSGLSLAEMDRITKQLEAESDEEKKARQNYAEALAIYSAAVDEHTPEPVRVYFPPVPASSNDIPDLPPFDTPADNPIACISVGTRHNLAVSRSGHVYSWGLGNQAQLGLGNQEFASVPTLVRSNSLKNYKAVAASAGGQHCVILARLSEQEEEKR